jgi:hypothetical protein
MVSKHSLEYLFLTLTSREAIFVLAKENNIGYQRALSTLTAAEQSRIISAIQGRQASKKTRQYSKRKQTKPVILKTRFGKIDEPFLPASVKRDGIEVAERAYLPLYIFENSIRNFINKVLIKEFGSDWWLTKMNTAKLSEVVARVKKRMEEEERRAWHGKRGAHPIYYSDFGDLILILKTHKKIFNKYLKNEKRKTEWLLLKLEETIPSRRVVAHHNPLLDRDLSRVEGNLMDWTKQLEFIRNNNLL